MDAREFLRALVPDPRADEVLWVAQFKCAPDVAGKQHWAGGPLNGAVPKGPVNGYISTGTFRNGGRRRKIDQIRALAIVLDDIGTDALTELPLEPTYELETSPHNYQVGYVLADGDKLPEVDALLQMLSARGFKLGPDKSGNNSVRYVRLPGCINNKRPIIEECGEPWTTRLEELHPERRYTLAQLSAAFATAAGDNVTGEDRTEARETDATLIADILSGKAFHDPFVRLAARWIRKGQSPPEVESGVTELADRVAETAPPDRLERLRQERQQIPRYVREAVHKYSADNGKAVVEAAIARLGEDVGAVFEPEAIAVLWAIRERNPADYQRYRKRIKDAGASVGELDRLVCANGGGAAQCSGQGRPLDVSDPEPWPERVDGAELLDGLAEIYRRYLVLPAHAATALALWTVHSYAYDYRSCTPCLGVSSPQKRCGKTRLLSIVAMLTLRALPASNITPSAVFRTVDIAHPTLIIDEADTFLRDNEELRGVINSGHTRDLAYVIRLVGEDHEPRKFSTWCPKVIAMIGKLPGTILDRSIVIKMSRRKKTEVIADLAEFTDAEQIRRRCIRWSEDNKVTIGNAKPKVPSELHDRAADNWQSLLALAELAEGVWPERARAAALALSEGTEDDAHSVMLLHDIRELFIGKPRSPKCFETPDNGMQITTEDMRAHLVDVEDRPWGECNRGKAITKNWIARRLSDYHITSHGVNPPGGTRGVSGYLLRDFADAFDRFLAPQADLDPSTQTSATPQAAPDVAFIDFQNSAAQNPAEFSNSWKPAPDKGCGDAEFSDRGVEEQREEKTRVIEL